VQAAVLDALLAAGQEWGRGGWADMMHEAFYPPGIPRKSGGATGSHPPRALSPSEPALEGNGHQVVRVCTTPEVSAVLLLPPSLPPLGLLLWCLVQWDGQHLLSENMTGPTPSAASCADWWYLVN